VSKTAVTIRLDEELHRRVKAKLAGENSSFQEKIQTMLEEYVDGPAEDREVIARQLEIARQAMRRYAPALRELAR
jgi:hypothetical protein